ncbi:PilZ domain-containing protein [Acidihalobacter aeolianus]|nr:PilZ domain-containing protein [Acidihalobacter aeolianus]
MHRLSDVLGESFKVLVQAPHFDTRIDADIFGYVPGKYVVLHSQRGRGGKGLGALGPKLGDSLIVRFLVEGIAYGFTSPVVHVQYRPDLLVFLQCPDLINKVSVRQELRLPCRLPCSLKDISGHTMPALLIDISSGGCQIASRELREDDREVGVAIKLQLTLPQDAGGEHEIAGKVVRLRLQNEAVIAGIGFDDHQHELMDKLRDFLCIDAPEPQAEPDESLEGAETLPQEGEARKNREAGAPQAAETGGEAEAAQTAEDSDDAAREGETEASADGEVQQQTTSPEAQAEPVPAKTGESNASSTAS